MTKTHRSIQQPIAGFAPIIITTTTILIDRVYDPARRLYVSPRAVQPEEGDLVYVQGDWHVAVPAVAEADAPLHGFARVGRIQGGEVIV